MKAQHTPGPWRAVNRGPFIATEQNTVIARTVNATADPALNCQCATVADLEQCANAELIAAAPEMFEALGRVLTKPAEKPEPDEEDGDPESRLRKMWTAKGVPQERQDEIIRDAIAKAQPGAQIGPWTIPAFLPKVEGMRKPAAVQLSLF